jgi:hypothetical protein
MKSQVLSKYVQQMKTIRLRIVRIENTYEINVTLFKKNKVAKDFNLNLLEFPIR